MYFINHSAIYKHSEHITTSVTRLWSSYIGKGNIVEVNGVPHEHVMSYEEVEQYRSYFIHGQ